MMELKGAIKNLKRDAEIRLTLDVEAQQSFEFLSDQVDGLRRAFSTLSDVLIEEVDLMRSDSWGGRSDLEDSVAWLLKTCRATRAELTLLRTQFEASRQELNGRAEALEDRLDGIGQDATLLAQEVASGSATQHLLQLELVELRAAFDREARERRDGHASHQARIADLTARFEAHSSQTQETIAALDEDLTALRQYAAGQLGVQAGGQVELRLQLQQVGEAVEDQIRTVKAQQQQLDGVSKAAGLRSQQLQVSAVGGRGEG
jgi:ferritin-like metal-binding protein YciE